MTNDPATHTPASPGPVPHHPATPADVDAERDKAEQLEVAGRHKNDGQKAHKGAR